MAAIQEYKCPCCGGAIAFDSTLQKMKCTYCDTEFEMETLAGCVLISADPAAAKSCAMKIRLPLPARSAGIRLF